MWQFRPMLPGGGGARACRLCGVRRACRAQVRTGARVMPRGPSSALAARSRTPLYRLARRAALWCVLAPAVPRRCVGVTRFAPQLSRPDGPSEARPPELIDAPAMAG